MVALPDRNQIPEQIAQCFREFCEAPPAKNADSVLKINVVSMPALGVQHSMYPDGIVSQAAADLTANARTSVWIMLIPNTPRYGAGSTPGNHQAFYEAVQEAARTVDEKLSTKVCLKYKMVTGLLEPGALRSAHREWRIDFLMIISSEVDEKGEFVSVWSKSNCWLRRNLSTGLRVMDRTMYRNWGASVMMAGGSWIGPVSTASTAVEPSSGIPSSLTCARTALPPTTSMPMSVTSPCMTRSLPRQWSA